VHDVIQSLIDGQEGFQKIGEHLKDQTLKKYFLAESFCGCPNNRCSSSRLKQLPYRSRVADHRS
jgi:hypothetical protein